VNNLKYQQYASFKLSWRRHYPVLLLIIMMRMMMLVMLLLLTQLVKTTPVNIMDQHTYPLEIMSWGQTFYPLSVRRRVQSPQSQTAMSNQKTYKEMSGIEEDDLTADLLQIHSLLQRVMQRQNIIMDQEHYICKACRQPDIANTVPSFSYQPNPAMQYVKTQQQLYNNKWKGKEILSINTDNPFHSKEQSDLTLRAMIGAGRRKNTRPMKLIRLKGKLISNHLHNDQLHSNLREMSKLVRPRNELLTRPISSLAVLSQVTQAESDTQGLTLVRRKRRRNRRKRKETGFMSLLEYH
jgi:hypothetical protein